MFFASKSASVTFLAVNPCTGTYRRSLNWAACLPQVHMVYESILDWDAFSIRIRQFSIEDVPAILGAVTEDQVGGAD